MSTTMEAQGREEQERHEAAEQAEAEARAEMIEGTDNDAGDGGLFDKSIYEREELQLPKVDGEPVDKIAIGFSGRVLLDRSDAADVALMRSMRLGGEVTLMVEAKCSGKAHSFSTDKEGDLDVVILEHKAKVHTVYRPSGEPAGESQDEPAEEP